MPHLSHYQTGFGRRKPGAWARIDPQGLGRGLKIAYPFNECGGSIARELANNTNPTITSPVYAPGNFGSTSLLYDGTTQSTFNDTVAAANVNVSEGSLLAWVYYTGSVTQCVIDMRAAGGDEIIIDTATAPLRLVYSAGGIANSTTASGFTSNAWHQLGITWSKSADQVKAYMDGVQIGSTLTGLGVFAGPVANCYVGTDSFAENWQGNIDHVLVWGGRVLKPAEFLLLYREPFAWLRQPAPRRAFAKAAAGGADNGTLTQTLGALTSSAAGQVLVQGAASDTLGALTGIETGAVLVQGFTNITAAPLTSSAGGTVLVQGQSAQTLGALAGTETGTVLVQGFANAMLADAMLAASSATAVLGDELEYVAPPTKKKKKKLNGKLGVELGRLGIAGRGIVHDRNLPPTQLGALTSLATAKIDVRGGVHQSLESASASGRKRETGSGLVWFRTAEGRDLTLDGDNWMIEYD